MSAVLLVTGAQAAGKTTIGRLVAGRWPRGVFLDGDVFWRAVVSGRADMTPDPTPEALRQLHLRYRALGQAARVYAAAGLPTVVADNVFGEDVQVLRDAVAPHDLLVVALVPSPQTVAARERGRGTEAYAGWSGPDGPDDGLLAAARTFDAWVRATPADLVHDSTGETPEQTAATVHAWASRRR
ncbi:phosphotransferase-like protein [Blastococcus sp. SYSU D00695]